MNDMIETGSLREKTMALLGLDDSEARTMMGIDNAERDKRQQEYLNVLVNVISNTVNSVMGQLAQQLVAQIQNDLTQITRQIATQMMQENAVFQQMVAMNQKVVSEAEKPRVVSLENVKMDENGKIIAATVVCDEQRKG